MSKASSRRDDGPDRVFHVTARVNWRVWHLGDEQSKRRLAKLVQEAADRFGVSVLAGVLMSNHFHAVVKSPSAERFRQLTSRRTACRHFRPWPTGHANSSVLSQFMRRIRHCMSIRTQAALNLQGRFWESNFDSRRVPGPFALVTRIAYDHRNPVKQRMVDRPEDFLWSTAAEWETGRTGPLPIVLNSGLPFDLSFQELRSEILRYQRSPQFDDISDEIAVLIEDGSREAWIALRELLRRQGLPWIRPGTDS